MLDEKVKSIKLDENPILERDIVSDKLGVLDIKAVLNDDIVADIEMQVIDSDNIEKRIMYYWSKMYSKEIQKGEDYSELKKAIVILITDFELSDLENLPKYHTKWNLREQDYPKFILTNVVELHILELPKVERLAKTNRFNSINKELESWIKFIISPDEMEVKDMEDVEEIKEAKEELDKIRQDKREEYLAHLREKYILDAKNYENTGIRKGKEQGIKQGIMQGIKQAKIEMAKRMLKKDADIEFIAEITELTKEEIEKLK